MLLLRLLLRRSCCCSLASTAVKSPHVRFPPRGCLTSTHSFALKRALSTSWTLMTNAPGPQDLDVWKSVMRSQALQEEKPEDGEEEPTPESEGELSPLESSRRLVETWRLAGKLVPEKITDVELETLAELGTKSSKRKYLKYLAIKEGHKKANREKKERKRAEKLAEKQTEQDDEGEEESEPKLRNTYLMHFWSRSMDRLMGWRVAQAMRFGQPLVYDMSYEQHMSRQEMENTISQLLETEGWNRRAAEPFHLHFCNLQPNGAYHRELLKRYSQETWDRLLITATSQQHIEVFPQESLVYLTADSPNVLRTYDHSKVYIVGAMVDRSIQSGVSLANAKRMKLATARLPLDEFLHWDSGAKNLTLDQMIRILMTAKETGSWEKALEFVPKRKHTGFYHQRKEDCAQPVRATCRHPDSGNGQLFMSKQRKKNPRPEIPSLGSEDISGQTRLRTALKSKLESRSKVTNKKNWWDEE
ncbi:tRNA methyltransferase 10 homolog C [Hoplias malabaricus]|uniref:tRNA methyltransferase 10 homolog C n=1 Tax=Hoplias malabaricus TaxID=27720 RepID=UPI003461A4DF